MSGAVEQRVELGSIDAVIRFDGTWSIVLVAAGADTSSPLQVVEVDVDDEGEVDAVIDDLLDAVEELDREASLPEPYAGVTVAGRDAAVAVLREAEAMVDAGTRALPPSVLDNLNALRAEIESPSMRDDEAMARAVSVRDEVAAVPVVDMGFAAVAGRAERALIGAGLLAVTEPAGVDVAAEPMGAAEVTFRRSAAPGPEQPAATPARLAEFETAMAALRAVVADDVDVSALMFGRPGHIERAIRDGVPLRDRVVEVTVERLREEFGRVQRARGEDPDAMTLDELLATGRVIAATTASEDYDGFGTRTVLGVAEGFAPRWSNSRPVRVVSMDATHAEWQRGRYDSGMNTTRDIDRESVRSFVESESKAAAVDATPKQRAALASLIRSIASAGHAFVAAGYAPDGRDPDVVQVAYRPETGDMKWSYVEADGYTSTSEFVPWPYTFAPSELAAAPLRDPAAAATEAKLAPVMRAIDETTQASHAERESWKRSYAAAPDNYEHLSRLRRIAKSTSYGVYFDDALRDAMRGLSPTQSVGDLRSIPLPDVESVGVCRVAVFDGGRGVAFVAWTYNHTTGERAGIAEMLDVFLTIAHHAKLPVLGRREAYDTSVGSRSGAGGTGTFHKLPLTVGYIYLPDGGAEELAAILRDEARVLRLDVRSGVARTAFGDERGFTLAAKSIRLASLSGDVLSVSVQKEGDDKEDGSVDWKAVMDTLGATRADDRSYYRYDVNLSALSEAQRHTVAALVPGVYLTRFAAPGELAVERTIGDAVVEAVRHGDRVTIAYAVPGSDSGKLFRVRDLVVQRGDHDQRTGLPVIVFREPRGRTDMRMTLPDNVYVALWTKVLTDSERAKVMGMSPSKSRDDDRHVRWYREAALDAAEALRGFDPAPAIQGVAYAPAEASGEATPAAKKMRPSAMLEPLPISAPPGYSPASFVRAAIAIHYPDDVRSFDAGRYAALARSWAAAAIEKGKATDSDDSVTRTARHLSALASMTDEEANAVTPLPRDPNAEKPRARVFYNYGLRVEADGAAAKAAEVTAAVNAGERALARELGVRHSPNESAAGFDGTKVSTGVVTTDPGWMLPDDMRKIKSAQRVLLADKPRAQRIVVDAIVAALRASGYEVTDETSGDTKTALPAESGTIVAKPVESQPSPAASLSENDMLAMFEEIA